MTDEADSQNKPHSRTRRSLFGAARASDTDEWLKELEAKAMDEKMRKWNFDFRTGRPLKPPGAESPSSSHVYEAVDEKEVPEFYRTKTVRTTAPTRPSIAALQASPRKPRLKVSESLKVGVEKASPEAAAAEDVGMTSPRKSKRLRKAQSMESTPRKRKKKKGIDEDDEEAEDRAGHDLGR